ncbi:hypothetical protein B0H16DRAFT_1594524, partial [Mycena metata]
MPWMQLSDLTLQKGAAPDVSLDILAQCANLVTVSVVTFPWTSLPTSRTKMITLPHLRTLELDFLHGADKRFMPFLNAISASALTRLLLYFGSDLPWSVSAFTTFQLRSPHLTSLELCYASLTSDDLRAALFHTPLLRDLNVYACPDCVDDALVRALHYERGSTPWVPRLRNLSLGGNSSHKLSENILASLIASRWWTDAEEQSGTAPTDIARLERVELQV